MSLDKERLDALIDNKYYIWQADDVLCYTMDSVLAANFLRLRSKARVLELGAGTGAISLICAIRGAEQVCGVDIEPRVIELFTRSIKENNLQERVQAYLMDLRDSKELSSLGHFDIVVANPPYRKAASGNYRNDAAGGACHELSATLEDFVIAAAKTIKTRGRFVMVNLAERLTDTISLLVKHRIEPKRLQMVHSKQDGAARLFLIEAVAGAQAGGLDILPPLIVYGADGEYTEQLKAYYKPQDFI